MDENFKKALSEWEKGGRADWETTLDRMKRVEFRSPEGGNAHWVVIDPETGITSYDEDFHKAWALNIQALEMLEAAHKRRRQRFGNEV